jgi:trans-aconitate 2-methyltransferase
MTQPREWDAATYHRVSAPQHSWGVRVLDRLVLCGDERVLDAGCGTGRVTQALVEKLRSAGDGGSVCALDRSIEMTRVARRTLPAEVPVVAADLLAMPFRQAFDVIFSTATFHWVLDPAGLYRGLARVLRPGGRLHAQCGGAGNIGRSFAQVMEVCAQPRFAPRFAGWKPAWAFLSPEEATRHLQAAGFIEIRAWLEPEPTTFASRDEFRVFIEKVVLGAWMVRFADAPGEGAAFLDEVCDAAAAGTPALTLDYVRLNLEAKLPGGVQ